MFKSDETGVCECSIRLRTVKMRVGEPVGPWPPVPDRVIVEWAEMAGFMCSSPAKPADVILKNAKSQELQPRTVMAEDALCRAVSRWPMPYCRPVNDGHTL